MSRTRVFYNPFVPVLAESLNTHGCVVAYVGMKPRRGSHTIVFFEQTSTVVCAMAEPSDERGLDEYRTGRVDDEICPLKNCG